MPCNSHPRTGHYRQTTHALTTRKLPHRRLRQQGIPALRHTARRNNRHSTRRRIRPPRIAHNAATHKGTHHHASNYRNALQPYTYSHTTHPHTATRAPTNTTPSTRARALFMEKPHENSVKTLSFTYIFPYITMCKPQKHVNFPPRKRPKTPFACIFRRVSYLERTPKKAEK